jgi:WD40 repeat protein
LRRGFRYLRPVAIGLLCALVFPQAGGALTTVSDTPILRIETGSHAGMVLGFSVSPDGKQLATASFDATIRLWSLPQLEPLRIIRLPMGEGTEGQAFSVGFSPDGKWLVTSGWTGPWGGEDGPWCFYVIDAATGEIVRTVCDLPQRIFQIGFSPDGNYIVATLKAGLRKKEGQGLRVYRASDFTVYREDKDYGDTAVGFDFDRKTGRLATASVDGKVRLYDKDFRLLKAQAMPEQRKPLAVSFSPDGERVAVGYAEPEGDDPPWRPAVELLKAEDLSVLPRPDLGGVTNGALWRVAWSEDGQFLYAAGTWQKGERFALRRWGDGGKGRPADITPAVNRIMRLVRAPQGIFFSAVSGNFGLIGRDNRVIAERTAAIADYTDIGDALAVSPDGRSIQFALEASGRRLAHFSLDTRLLEAGPSVEAGMTHPITEMPNLDVRDWIWSYKPTLNGVPLKMDLHDAAVSMTLMPRGEGLVLGTSGQLIRYDAKGNVVWAKNVYGNVRGVVVTPDNRLVVAALNDGTIRWYSMEDKGKELLAFFPHADGQRWVLWTPSAYYMASVGGDGLIGWHVNRGKEQTADFFSIARFRDIYYRPDIVDKILGTLDEGQAIKRGDAETGRATKSTDLAALLPPVVTINAPADGTVINVSKVSFAYDIRRRSPEAIKALQLRADGRPIAVLEAGPGPIAERGTIEAYVPRRDATIEMIAETASGIWSEPAAVQLSWKGLAEEIKPSLFILAVGISQYRAPELKLALADKDANDFKNVFDQQKKTYRKVEIVTLANEKATSAEIRHALDWFASAPTSHDVAMLFMAGHGVDDQGGRYFFVPQEVGPKEALSQGLSYQDIRRALASVAGRVLFFIDTCHAGAAWGNPGRPVTDVSRMVNDLNSPENRVMTFASSTARQLSYENVNEWGNGAFTKAVVEGLTGKADFFQNGYVTASQLDTYVSDRVPKLTLGKQTPAIGRPFGVDYPLVQLR